MHKRGLAAMAHGYSTGTSEASSAHYLDLDLNFSGVCTFCPFLKLLSDLSSEVIAICVPERLPSRQNGAIQVQNLRSSSHVF